MAKKIFLSIFLFLSSIGVLCLSAGAAVFAQVPPSAACSLPVQQAYKHPDHSGVWYVDEHCTKRPFKNERTFFSYFERWSDVRTVTEQQLMRIPDSALGLMPWGPRVSLPDMSLIKTTEDPNVYLVIDNTRLRYASEEAVYAQKAKFSWIIDVDPRVVQSLTAGPDITDSHPYPDGIVFKYPNAATVYRLHEGKKRAYSAMSALREDGVRTDHLLVMPLSQPWADGVAITRGEQRRYLSQVYARVDTTPINLEEERRLAREATQQSRPRSNGASIMDASVKNLLSQNREAAPLTWSIPLGTEENITQTANLRLVRDGEIIPAQFTPMARWGGSPSDTSAPIAWLLVDTQLDLRGTEQETLSLITSSAVLPTSPLTIVRNTNDDIVIDTGAAEYELSKRAFAFFDRVTLSTGEVFTGTSGIEYKGRRVAKPATIRVEHQGPERISLWVHGTIAEGLEYTARLHFYRNLAEVKIDFRVENLNDTTVVNGQPQANDIGSPGSVSFDDLSLIIAGNTRNDFIIPQGELGVLGVESGRYTQSLSLMQESSGDVYWSALKGYGDRLQAAVQKQQSTKTIDGKKTNGPNRMAGWFDANGVSVAVYQLWQNFPKALRAEQSAVEIGLFPKEWAKNHNLRAGEFKTHTVWVRHHGASVSDVASRAHSFLSPLRLLAHPDDLMDTQAAGLFAPRNDAEFPAYEEGVDYQVTPSPKWRDEYLGGKTIQESISMGNAYGYMDYGDIPTDFEVLQSPYGHKYGSLKGSMFQAYRSNNEVWWELAESGAHHSADVNIFHSDIRGYATPRAWWQGGSFGHCYHNEDSRKNPHRNYCNTLTQHTYYTDGIFLWAFMTGDTLLLESAIESADNIYWKTVNSNYGDGAQCAVAAGLQRCDGTDPVGCPGYEPIGPSRDAGNFYKTLQMAYLATGDTQYFNVLQDYSEYLNCREATVGYDGIVGPTCNRFHFAGTFVSNLGQYLLLRERVGLPADTASRTLLANRMTYMTGTLWNDQLKLIEYCYYDDVVDRTLTSRYDNWLLTLADAFAVGGLVLDRPNLITYYGYHTFLHGSENTSYRASAQAYFSTKEFVNQVGFGHMFLYAWKQR